MTDWVISGSESKQNCSHGSLYIPKGWIIPDLIMISKWFASRYVKAPFPRSLWEELEKWMFTERKFDSIRVSVTVWSPRIKHWKAMFCEKLPQLSQNPISSQSDQVMLIISHSLKLWLLFKCSVRLVTSKFVRTHCLCKSNLLFAIFISINLLCITFGNIIYRRRSYLLKNHVYSGKKKKFKLGSSNRYCTFNIVDFFREDWNSMKQWYYYPNVSDSTSILNT